MTNPNITDPLAGEAQLTSSDGSSAVGESMTLAELNQMLGKTFTDKSTALKAVKDTFAFVGKRKEDIARELATSNPSANQSPDVEAQLKEVKEELFYTQNPQYVEYRSIIKMMGSNPADVVSSDAFKPILENGTVAKEVAKTKSVVASNPRLAQSRTAVESAVAVANSRNASVTDVAESLSKAIASEYAL